MATPCSITDSTLLCLDRHQPYAVTFSTLLRYQEFDIHVLPKLYPFDSLHFSYFGSVKIKIQRKLPIRSAYVLGFIKNPMLLNLEYLVFSLLEKFCQFPCRSVEKAAFALIAAVHEEQRQYLLQWNPKWQCYNFIGGKVQKEGNDNNDFARTIRREIKEEMGIELETLLVEQEIKQIRLWQFSEREKRMKLYQFSIFEIQFFPDLPVNRQIILRSLRWLSSQYENIYVHQDEIMNLKTVAGKPISKTVRRILLKLGEISTA